MPIRAVLFDLDGTLYRQPTLRLLMALELATLPLAGPGKTVRRLNALRAYREAQEDLRREPSAAPERDQIAVAVLASGLPVAEVEALVDDWMMRRPLKYLQFCRAAGVDRLLNRLDELGMRMGVLSDYPPAAKLRALGLGGRFSPVLWSGDAEIGALKPSPRGFLRACDVWRLTPAEVLFVGDRVDVDAVGAAAAGMRCVIVGRSRGVPTPAASYVQLPSLERLCGVFDHH